MNLDEKRRDEIIFGSYDKKKYGGRIRGFWNLGVKSLEKLVEENFIDLSDSQNAAPTAGEIYEFMKKYQGYKAHGYAVSAERKDYRITLTGVTKDTAAEDFQELEDFKKLFDKADEFSTDGAMYCWYD